MASEEAIDAAIARLTPHGVYRADGRDIDVAFLLRHADWRPLRASWWTGKEVSIIGADLDGNFFLRHCDGSVRYWEHRSATDSVVAQSVRVFASQIESAPQG